MKEQDFTFNAAFKNGHQGADEHQTDVTKLESRE